MNRILITGGTVFVSRRAAEYFIDNGYEVYVLNRNTRPQIPGARLIEADRHNLKDCLKGLRFDAVADVTAYDAEDVNDLLDALDTFGKYILISSSAVYPETGEQPFRENTPTGPNSIWGKYGTDKIAAEKALTDRVPDAYILRPPYLYGAGNNVYREAFVFDCAAADRPFYLPGDGNMKLQFSHVYDLCRLMRTVIETSPAEHIINTGDTEPVSIREWVTECYACLGKTPVFVHVNDGREQRQYFPFYNYEYRLDVSIQNALCPASVLPEEGLNECLRWYRDHEAEVRKKPLIGYIDSELKR